MSLVQQLHRLQTIDSKIDEAKLYLRKIAANLGKNKALIEAEEAEIIATKASEKAQSAMRKLEGEVKVIATKIAAEDKKLYGGKTVSAKEANNLQNEIASLKRRHTQLEEQLLEAMMVADETSEVATTATQTLIKTQETWESEQEKLIMLQLQFEEKLKNLTATRIEVVADINPSDVVTYTNLRKKKAGRAVSEVNRTGLCQGCNVSVPSSKQRQARDVESLVYCDMCGRILYVV